MPQIAPVGGLMGGGGLIQPPGILGLKFTINPASGEWAGLIAAAAMAGDSTNLVKSLTHVNNGDGNNFTDIVAGQATADTGYTGTATDDWTQWDSTETVWGDGVNDPVSGYILFAALADITEVQLLLNNTTSFYPWDSIVFEDSLGNTLTPATAPTDYTDNNGDTTIDGQTSGLAAGKAYKWTFSL